MDATTIAKIEQLVLSASQANRLPTHTPAIVLGGSIMSLEDLQEGRSRFRGAFATTVLHEFSMYVKANPGGHGFIDPKECRATVFLNLGSPDEPGHADWTATLNTDATAAYRALQAIDGKPKSQRELVEWIEDWAPLLQAQFGDDVDPLPVSSALAAIRTVAISAKSEATHTDRDFGASRSALEEIEAKAAGGLPKHLFLTTMPYAGFSERQFKLRLSVVTGEKPHFVLRLVAAEAVREDIAREFKSLLLESIGDAATMVLGTFNP